MEKNNALKYIAYIFLSIVSLTSALAQGEKDTILGNNDSLSAYVFPDFRDMDTALRSTYPFVDYSKNNYQFYSKESPNFETLYSKLDKLITTKKGKLNIQVNTVPHRRVASSS